VDCTRGFADAAGLAAARRCLRFLLSSFIVLVSNGVNTFFHDRDICQSTGVKT